MHEYKMQTISFKTMTAIEFFEISYLEVILFEPVERLVCIFIKIA